MLTIIQKLLGKAPIVEAHCDTTGGPVVTDGRRAIDSGDLAFALKWIPADGEAELRDVFERTQSVRTLSPQAAEVADRLFLETLVRIHRISEGAGFAGIHASDATVDPVVVAADHALDTGDLEPLRSMVPAARFPELSRRFDRARSLREFAVDDVEAGRKFIAAYVSYFKYAEGEDHVHQHAFHSH